MRRRRRRKRLRLPQLPSWFNLLPFAGLHLACLAVFTTGAHAIDWIMCGVLYFVRVFGLTAAGRRKWR